MNRNHYIQKNINHIKDDYMYIYIYIMSLIPVVRITQISKKNNTKKKVYSFYWVSFNNPIRLSFHLYKYGLTLQQEVSLTINVIPQI